MSAPLVRPSDCCTECPDGIGSQVPGPQGPPGADGTNGTNGTNPFTFTDDDFIVPNVDASDIAKVLDSTWMYVGQIIEFQGAGINDSSATKNGYFLVASKPNAFQVELTNPNALADLNKAPGSIIPIGKQISTSGPRGAAGTPGTGVTLDDISPTTTKGDLIVDNGANSPDPSAVRLGTGGAPSDGMVLAAQSGQPAGLQWQAIDLSEATSQLDNELSVARLSGSAPSAAATGDIIRYTGAQWEKFDKGTASQVLRTKTDASDIEWVDPAEIITGIIQVDSANSITCLEVTGAIPVDDTIPQKTEGAEILKVLFTPLISTSRLVVTGYVEFSALNGTQHVTMAIFLNSDADAISASARYVGTAATLTQGIIEHEFSPGSTALIGIALRIGAEDGTAIAVNGIANGAGGSRRFGGVSNIFLRVTEYST